MGYLSSDYLGKPVIAIVNTWSDINPCHSHFKQRVEEVKRGVWQAGGFPVEIPAMTLAETFQKPTTMLYRNLLAMETEEILRSYPADGCVLMGGCDKTTPALIMGAISMDLPTIYVPAGPMLRGDWNGVVLGSGSDTWKYWAELRCGNITQEEWNGIENGIARSPGHCMTMGTASTMTSATEVLGLTLPGFSSIPAPDSRHAQMATQSGKRIVDMVWEDLKPSDVLTDASFDNAVTTVLALSGSARRRRARPRPLRRDRAAHAGARQHPPGRQVPHGGLLLRRWSARAARAARRSARWRHAEREREDAGRERRRCEGLQRRRHPEPQHSTRRVGWTGRAVRQPRAARRGDEAAGRGACAPLAHRPRRRLLQL
jgi:hypothetical protein